MYLRPNEVVQVLEQFGFKRDYVVDYVYGYRKGNHYVYVNREARMGRTALLIHPALKDKSRLFAMPTEGVRISNKYLEFPRYSDEGFYGISHGFSSRELLLRYLHNMF